MISLSGVAEAAEVHLFPVRPGLVPVVVAGAFVLPAIICGVMYGVRRAGRIAGPVLGAGLIVAAIAAVTAYGDPGLLRGLRI